MKDVVFDGNFVKVTVKDGIEKVYLRGSVHTFLVTDEGSIRLTLEKKLGSNEIREKLQSGILEDNENPRETAKRELYEELGIEAQEWEEFLVQESQGTVNDVRYYFLAKKLKKTSSQVDGEVLDTKDYTIEELYQKAMNGDFSPATQAAIARLYYKGI